MGKSRLIYNRGLAPLGIAIGAGLFYLAARNLHWAEVWRALREAHLFPWLPLAVISYLAGHFVRGIRTQSLVSRDAKLTLPTATNVVVLGYAVNNILPARLGEIARAGMLAERTGLPVAQSLTVTLLERILDGWVLFLLLAATSLVVPMQGWMHEIMRIAAAVFFIATAGIAAVLFSPHVFLSTTARLSSVLSPRWHDRAIRLSMHVVQGLAYLRRPRQAARVVGLSAIVWLLETGLFLMLFPAFGIPFKVSWALLAMTVTNLGILAPSTPGFIGPFHFFCMKSLTAMGVAQATALSAAIVIHLAFFVPITLWGVGIVFWYGLELGSTIAMAQGAKRLTVAEPK